jgi:hypothetical protein
LVVEVTRWSSSLKPLLQRTRRCRQLQAVIALIKARKIEVPVDVVQQADRLGALSYGLLRAELIG